MKKKIFRTLIALAMALVLCVVSFVPSGAKSYEEMSDEEYNARSLFFVYFNFMDTFPSAFGVTDTESFNYDGTVTADNIDRIFLTSLMLDIAMSAEMPPYISETSENIELTLTEATDVVKKTYLVSSVDMTLSSFYDSQSGKIVIKESDIGMEPSLSFFSSLQDSFDYSIKSIEGGLYEFEATGWVMFSNHQEAGYVTITFQMSSTDLSGDTENDVYISSVSVTTETPTLVIPEEYQVIDNWYIAYIRPETSLMDFGSKFTGELKGELMFTDTYGESKTSGFVGTGDVVMDADNAETPWDYFILVVKGDVSGDGKIGTVDYMRIKKSFNGEYELWPEEFLAADVNGDERITTTDYMKIKKAFTVGSDILF